MKKRELKNGRKKALQILRKIGGDFHKKIALRMLEENKIQNPEGKFNLFVKDGHILKKGDGLYKVT